MRKARPLSLPLGYLCATITAHCPCPRAASATGTRAGISTAARRSGRSDGGAARKVRGGCASDSEGFRSGPHRDGSSHQHTRYLGEPVALPQAAGHSRGSPALPGAIEAGPGQNQRSSRPRRVGAAAAPAEGPREALPCAGQCSALQPPQHSPGPRSAAAAPLRCRSGSAHAAAAAFCSRSAASPAHRATAAAAAHWPPSLPRARCLSARRALIGCCRWGAAV